MWKQLSDWLHRISSTWTALSGLAIFLLFSALVLPDEAARTRTYAEGVGSPDMSFLYSPDDLYDTAEAYGDEGRKAYVRARFTFDIIWPLAYTVFLCAAISWVYERAVASSSRWRLANLAPLLGALLDYLENASTSIVMLRYPNQTAVLDVLAPIFTFVKWILVGGSFALLLAGAVAGIWRWIRKSNANSTAA
jgi:hypothetical protein